MKQLFIFVFIFSCLCLSIQGQELSVIGKTTTFSYDLNGNIISRSSVSLASAKTQGGMKEESGGDMTIIGGGNGKFTIDIKKDANQTANFSLYNTQPNLLVSDRFTSSTYTVDLTDYPNGIYIFNVEVGEKEYSEKVLYE